MDKLTQDVITTAEVCGANMSEAAAEMIVRQLENYPLEAVLQSLYKCQRELKGRITLSEILSRIEDGRPGPEEAWASLVWDEASTMVVTSETMQAAGVARPLFLSGDRVGAAKAFREAYVRLLTEAREQNKPITWQLSLGHDKAGREGAIMEAVQRKRMTVNSARIHLPDVEISDKGELMGSIGARRGRGGLESASDIMKRLGVRK